jgi:hypothetical protein
MTAIGFFMNRLSRKESLHPFFVVKNKVLLSNTHRNFVRPTENRSIVSLMWASWKFIPNAGFFGRCESIQWLACFFCLVLIERCPLKD